MEWYQCFNEFMINPNHIKSIDSSLIFYADVFKINWLLQFSVKMEDTFYNTDFIV